MEVRRIYTRDLWFDGEAKGHSSITKKRVAVHYKISSKKGKYVREGQLKKVQRVDRP